VFNSNFGHDTITDFRPGLDRIQFHDTSFGSFIEVEAGAVQTGADLVITDATGDTIVIENMNLASLQASDFLIL